MKQSVTTFLIALLLMMAPAANAFAASLDDIFGEFKDHENVEYVKIPRFVMWLTGLSNDFPSVAKKITGIKVLTINDGSAKEKNSFDKRFNSLSAGHDLMLSAKEDGETVKIFTKASKDKMKDLYIHVTDSSETVLIKLSGTFTADDIKAVASDQISKNK